MPQAPEHTSAPETPEREQGTPTPQAPEHGTATTEDVEPTLERKNPREGLTVHANFCTRLKGSECQRCLAVCPYNAITLDDETGPHIDHAACTRCGLCRGICDAFMSIRITLADLADKVMRLQQEFGRVYFTCNEHIFEGFIQAENVIVLPCLAAMPPEFWTRILVEDCSCYVFLDRSYCDACPTAGAHAKELYTHAMRTAEAWSGGHFLHADEIPEQGFLVDEYANAAKNDFNRRGVLSSLKDQTLDIATGKRRQRGNEAISDYRERMERMKARNQANMDFDIELNGLIPTGPIKRLWPRRRLLLEALDAHPERTADVQVFCANTDAALCQLSQDCMQACPTGARQLVEDTSASDETGAGTARIEVDPRLCIACGICVATCPHGACDFVQMSAADLRKE